MLNTWTSLAISDAVLAFSSFFGVFLMSQGCRLVSQRIPVVGALLAYGLVATGATLGTLTYGVSMSWEAPYLMIMTAAKTLSPPLLATALATLCWKLTWSRQAWWRLLIGLMAGYELSRQTGYSEQFLYIAAATSLVITATAALSLTKLQPTFTLFIVVSVCAYGLAALVIGTEGKIAGYLRLDLYRYLLALGNLFSASGIFIMLKQQARDTHEAKS